MPFSSLFIILYACICIHINKKLRNAVCVSRKSIFNTFTCSVEHAFLYFIIIWLAVLTYGRIWTQRACNFFPLPIYGFKQEFHWVHVWKYDWNRSENKAHRDLWIINWIIQFHTTPAKQKIPCGVEGIIYAFISVHYPSREGSIKPWQSLS